MSRKFLITNAQRKNKPTFTQLKTVDNLFKRMQKLLEVSIALTGMIRILIFYMEIQHLILSGRAFKSYLLHATMLEYMANMLFLLAATLTFKRKETT